MVGYGYFLMVVTGRVRAAAMLESGYPGNPRARQGKGEASAGPRIEAYEGPSLHGSLWPFYYLVGLISSECLISRVVIGGDQCFVSRYVHSCYLIMEILIKP